MSILSERGRCGRERKKNDPLDLNTRTERIWRMYDRQSMDADRRPGRGGMAGLRVGGGENDVADQ